MVSNLRNFNQKHAISSPLLLFPYWLASAWGGGAGQYVNDSNQLEREAPGTVDLAQYRDQLKPRKGWDPVYINMAPTITLILYNIIEPQAHYAAKNYNPCALAFK